MWPWGGGGALTTAEAANWALAESRVFELDSLNLVDCGPDRDRTGCYSDDRAQTTTPNINQHISQIRQIHKHTTQHMLACCIRTDVLNVWIYHLQISTIKIIKSFDREEGWPWKLWELDQDHWRWSSDKSLAVRTFSHKVCYIEYDRYTHTYKMGYIQHSGWLKLCSCR